MTTKTLVATHLTQGQRPGDFAGCVEGELVVLLSQCGNGPDCACTRSFAGLNSQASTSTARVAELPYDLADYIGVLRATLADFGADPGAAPAVAGELMRLVADWPVGTIVGRDGDYLQMRRCGCGQAANLAEHDPATHRNTP